MAIYKQTVNEIKVAAVTVNPNGRFEEGRVVDLSQKFKGSYPMIWLYPWRISDPDPRNFLYRHPLVIGFWEPDKPHSSVEERREIIHRMEVLKDLFVAKLKEQNPQHQISALFSEPQYQMHNQTVSGYAVSFTYENFSPC